MKTGCLVEDCTRPHFARDYCKPHWRRLMKYGDPLSGPPIEPFSRPQTTKLTRVQVDMMNAAAAAQIKIEEGHRLRDANIAALWESGVSASRIARFIKMSPRGVINILERRPAE